MLKYKDIKPVSQRDFWLFKIQSKYIFKLTYQITDMDCPTCQTKLHPNMHNTLIGKNNRNVSIFVYYQICPECGEPIIGIKESARGEVYMNPNNIEGITFFSKERRKGKNENQQP